MNLYDIRQAEAFKLERAVLICNWIDLIRESFGEEYDEICFAETCGILHCARDVIDNVQICSESVCIKLSYLDPFDSIMDETYELTVPLEWFDGTVDYDGVKKYYYDKSIDKRHHEEVMLVTSSIRTLLNITQLEKMVEFMKELTEEHGITSESNYNQIYEIVSERWV